MLTVYSAYDRSCIATLPWSSEEQIEESLAKAYALHRKKSPLPKAERIAILQRSSCLVRERSLALAHTAAEEGGKPLADSLVEVERAAQGIEAAVAHLMQMAGEEIPMQLTAASEGRIAFTFHEPAGVILAISAFNHPFNLIVHQVIPAVAAGCPVIVKPALATPLSCLNLVALLHEAGLPREWCQAIIAPDEVTEKIVGDSRLSFVTFIGSSRVGWMIRSKLHPGVDCMLEHGGAAPVLVEPDATLEDAIPLLIKGGFYHAGQVCVSVQRIFVHESISQRFAEEFSATANQLTVGNPLQKETQVGPLIHPREVERIDQWVTEAVDGGATLLSGGNQISATCYAPTVLLNPPEAAKVSQNEIFGPVVCIYSYCDRHAAIERANAPPFCFQAALFTHHIDTAFDIARKLEATAVMINDHTAFRTDWMPFGGRKTSGLHMGGIPGTIEAMSAKKMMLIRSPAFQTGGL